MKSTWSCNDKYIQLPRADAFGTTFQFMAQNGGGTPCGSGTLYYFKYTFSVFWFNTFTGALVEPGVPSIRLPPLGKHSFNREFCLVGWFIFLMMLPYLGIKHRIGSACFAFRTLPSMGGRGLVLLATFLLSHRNWVPSAFDPNFTPNTFLFVAIYACWLSCFG